MRKQREVWKCGGGGRTEEDRNEMDDNMRVGGRSGEGMQIGNTRIRGMSREGMRREGMRVGVMRVGGMSKQGMRVGGQNE